MSTTNDKSFYGYINKKEELKSFDLGAPHQAFTLLATNPFPGYSQQVTRNLFYMVLSNMDAERNENIYRSTQDINRNHRKSIEASPCELTIYNKFFNAIRLYNHTPEQIEEIEILYKRYGMVFLKKMEVKPFTSLVKVYKLFELNELCTDIYQSRKDPKFSYLKVPFKLSWEDFEWVIQQVKEKGNYTHCDFALAVFHSKDGLEDYIRIYSDPCHLESLKEFQNSLLESIRIHTLK